MVLLLCRGKDVSVLLMATDFIIVFVTFPTEDEAARIGRILVEEELTSCMNIIPAVRSIYRWKGEVRNEGEALSVMKTRRALFEALKERVIELHPYEVPEVIATRIEAGHSDYLEWIAEVTKKP